MLHGGVAMVHAWIERSTLPLYVVKAEIVQDRQSKATALAKPTKNAPSSDERSAQG